MIGTLVGILVGIALSAACGFRVFVPLLVLGIAGRVGHVSLAGDFHWITSVPPPVLRWGLAIVAGGGAAGTVQGATVLARLKSGAMTAGLANPIVATAELTGSVVTSVLAVLAPLLAVALIVLLLVWIYRTSRRFFFGRGALAPSAPDNEVLDASRDKR
jgi:hypothetical protein